MRRRWQCECQGRHVGLIDSQLMLMVSFVFDGTVDM
jgi:hypothetical protein